MKIVVIDDEINSRELMKTLLTDYCDLKDIYCAASVREGLDKINLHKPQLVFLDIELEGENGFDLLDNFSHFNFLVCFATGYEQYAIKAIKYGAFGYLLKPIDIEELKDIVKRAQEKLNTGIHKETDRLIVNENDKYWMLNYKDILQIESAGNYTYIHTLENKILTQSKLAHYEDCLPEEIFYRTHRGYIVNLTKIKQIKEGRTGLIVLDDGSEIPIASRRIKDFKGKLDLISK